MDKKITVLEAGAEERRYQLNLDQGELALIASLLNSVNDREAVPLRQAVNQEIKANNAFILLRTRKIILCPHCQGASNVVLTNKYDEFDTQGCSKCKGEGRLLVTTSKLVRPVTPELLRMHAEVPPKFSAINY